jgi:hypothetical protein
MVEGAGSIFRIRRTDISGKARERRIREPETKLLERETLIAESAREKPGIKKKKAGLRQGKGR